jgi:hypothetical protein
MFQVEMLAALVLRRSGPGCSSVPPVPCRWESSRGLAQSKSFASGGVWRSRASLLDCGSPGDRVPRPVGGAFGPPVMGEAVRAPGRERKECPGTDKGQMRPSRMPMRLFASIRICSRASMKPWPTPPGVSKDRRLPSPARETAGGYVGIQSWTATGLATTSSGST